ncbi:DUF883 family protein [Halomonas sp. DP8Y7-3]|uniref:DUF883 family protein n=1 Tax=Halomonas sp. DP8Y7-3 TaxID=2859079 RepID=UPI001C96BBAA|nr:DUF883 family protein [Halomonas sp. DP8Y7-3]MBY5930684.1 DUF883 family protein [Halomonas sp. DP8Y7-3]
MATRSSSTTSKTKADAAEAASSSASTEQLRADLKQLSTTLEDLLSATADDSSEAVKEWRSKAEARLKDTRARLEATGERVYRQTRDSVTEQVDACDRYVHDNPWKSIGIGAAAGVVIGMLLGRR